METNIDTRVPRIPAAAVEPGFAVTVPSNDGLLVTGIVSAVFVAPDDRAGYTRYSLVVETADFVEEVSMYEEDEVALALLTTKSIDAVIDGHTALCPDKTPDKCSVCDILWSARADSHHGLLDN